jgi:branched-chain amino acid transport system permease protein
MLGSIYALVALGWTLIYKCSGVLNLAMGELTLIGAYVCLTLYRWLNPHMAVNLAFILAILLTLGIGGLLGLLTEHGFLRKMIGEPVLSVIMVTVGLSFFFKGTIFIIWDADTQIFTPRIFPLKPIMIGNIVIGQVYLWSFVAALILLVVFVCFFKYTRWGLSMQATADDEMAALSLGVSAKFVYALAWAIAFMAAGVGGTLLGNINGLNYSVGLVGLVVLPAVVLGGLNSVDRFFPGGVKEVAPFAIMVVFLLFKPYGFWGWQRIERV